MTARLPSAPDQVDRIIAGGWTAHHPTGNDQREWVVRTDIVPVDLDPLWTELRDS
ncbi:hypothetical protein [Actinoplanes siamensis]|uniref:hypothetical protein n=1 Tax=Actinoplanes siamensis TaxID=1223317 RepID=UPI001942B47B|nr:hypothetical protein [Actinoplanes siamensis]